MKTLSILRGPRPPYIRRLMVSPHWANQEPASPASPEAAPDTGDAEAVGPEEKARRLVWEGGPQKPGLNGPYNSYKYRLI